MIHFERDICTNIERASERVRGFECHEDRFSPFALVFGLGHTTSALLVGRDDGQTVFASDHWFGDWGRDTMTAMPGIAVVTGCHDNARGVLRVFSRYEGDSATCGDSGSGRHD